MIHKFICFCSPISFFSICAAQNFISKIFTLSLKHTTGLMWNHWRKKANKKTDSFGAQETTQNEVVNLKDISADVTLHTVSRVFLYQCFAILLPVKCRWYSVGFVYRWLQWPSSHTDTHSHIDSVKHDYHIRSNFLLHSARNIWHF